MQTTGPFGYRRPAADQARETKRKTAQRLVLNRQVNPNPYVPSGPNPNRRPGTDKPLVFTNPRSKFNNDGPGSIFRR